MEETGEITKMANVNDTNFTVKEILNSKCDETANSRKKYRQTYKKEWEQDSLFKGWLSPMPDDKYKAICTACEKECLAHRITLMKHASSAKHLKCFRAVVQKMEANIDISEQQFETPLEQIVQDNSIKIDSDSPVTITELVSIQEVVNEKNNLEFPSNVALPPSDTEMVSFENEVKTTQVQSCLTDKLSSNECPLEKVPDNLNLFIPSESYIDISASPEAINFKPGYTTKHETNLKNNTVILSCGPAFVSERSEGSHEEVTLNKIATRPLQVSTRVTDYSRGVSVANLNISLYKLSSGKWICVADDQTDDIGRCNFFPKSETFFAVGCYKLHYDVASYYELQNLKSYFPYIEVAFIIKSPNETHHVPLMVSPNGYTAYRSLDF